MNNRSVYAFLQDIEGAIVEIENFMNEISLAEFQKNREKILAVIKLLEIIGEAVKQIPQTGRDRYPQIPWQSIAGMRDVLVHAYWQIDPNGVWATVHESLPPLKPVIHEIRLDSTPTRNFCVTEFVTDGRDRAAAAILKNIQC